MQIYKCIKKMKFFLNYILILIIKKERKKIVFLFNSMNLELHVFYLKKKDCVTTTQL